MLRRGWAGPSGAGSDPLLVSDGLISCKQISLTVFLNPNGSAVQLEERPNGNELYSNAPERRKRVREVAGFRAAAFENNSSLKKSIYGGERPRSSVRAEVLSGRKHVCLGYFRTENER